MKISKKICICEKNVVSLQAEMKMTPDKRAILALPPEIDFKGTMIMVRIPAQVPDSFNLYNYMS